MGDLTKNFSRAEFSCKCGCGFDTIDFQILEELQQIRDRYGSPITINSACRCKEHNESIGGSERSQHLKGRAVDFTIKGVNPEKVYNSIDYYWKGGLGRYSTFTHIDSRSVKARWG